MQLYTVEKIVGRRVRKGGIIQYKVKWLNYDEEDCTWEPFKNLQYVEDMVKAYEGENTYGQVKGKIQFKPKIKVDNKQKDQGQSIFNDQYQQEQKRLNSQPDLQNNNEYQNQGQFVHAEEIYQAEQQKQKKPQYSHWDDDQVPDFDIELQSLSFQDQQRAEMQKISAPRKLNKHQEQQMYYQQQKQMRKTPQKNIQKSKPKKAAQQQQKSYLQQVQQRTRFIVKNPPKKKANDQIPRMPKPGELKVLQVSSCSKTNQLIYLTQFGEIITYRRQTDMKRLFPDQLIRFYQSRIQFAKIPKMPAVK